PLLYATGRVLVSAAMIATEAVPRVTTKPGSRDHVFFGTMSVAMAAVVGIGFPRTYFHRMTLGTATPLIHVHASIFAAWMLLFIAQALLVAGGHTRMHRRTGVGGAFFAALMLVVGTVTGVIAARHGYRGPLPTQATALQ